MDESRGVWWLVRKDSDPRGVWRFTADPSGSDWRWMVGSAKSARARHYRVLRERAEYRAKVHKKCTHIRGLIDIMRGNRGPESLTE